MRKPDLDDFLFFLGCGALFLVVLSLLWVPAPEPAEAPAGVYEFMTQRLDAKDHKIAELLKANDGIRLALEACLEERP